MKRATPVEMRKCLEAVQTLKKYGIRFVPIPSLDDIDQEALKVEMVRRLELLEKRANSN